MTNYNIFFAILIIFLSVLESYSNRLCIHLPNIALIGGTYDELPNVDIKTCCMSCWNDPCCMFYTYDVNRRHCDKKATITESKNQRDIVSGVKPNDFRGSGARLRNIKIWGGKGNQIEVDTLQDCENYCYAFSMCTWMLKPKNHILNEGDKKGKCTCYKQIDHLIYAYGINSSIMPHTQFGN
uniref:Apple domain-containing protein n=1 Tax=Strongyloides papillosus TaxID=174720 RepID=A0A0N5C3Q6_STREA